MSEEEITIPIEVARRLFDLAVDSPLVCSGSFETDDVVVLRRLAEAIGVDPAQGTPDEFVRDFPHWFVPFNVDLERERVDTGEYRQGIGVQYPRTRPETDEEVYARLGAKPDLCGAGAYRRRCRRPQDDPIHLKEAPL